MIDPFTHAELETLRRRDPYARKLLSVMNTLRSLVTQLLASVTPRCFNCSRPATRYLGSPFNGAPARQYACDAHATAEGKWSDLPNAGAIREAIKL